MNLQKIDEIVKNISIEEVIKEIEKDEKNSKYSRSWYKWRQKNEKKTTW